MLGPRLHSGNIMRIQSYKPVVGALQTCHQIYYEVLSVNYHFCIFELFLPSFARLNIGSRALAKCSVLLLHFVDPRDVENWCWIEEEMPHGVMATRVPSLRQVQLSGARKAYTLTVLEEATRWAFGMQNLEVVSGFSSREDRLWY
jgi:hypothetical protein